MPFAIEQLLYLVAAVLFIIGLKRLSSPVTARHGNMLSGVGMLIAILVTLFDRGILSFQAIAIGVGVGALIGYLVARRCACSRD